MPDYHVGTVDSKKLITFKIAVTLGYREWKFLPQISHKRYWNLNGSTALIIMQITCSLCRRGLTILFVRINEQKSRINHLRCSHDFFFVFFLWIFMHSFTRNHHFQIVEIMSDMLWSLKSVHNIFQTADVNFQQATL